jgi:hypothetical protein
LVDGAMGLEGCGLDVLVDGCEMLFDAMVYHWVDVQG